MDFAILDQVDKNPRTVAMILVAALGIGGSVGAVYIQNLTSQLEQRDKIAEGRLKQAEERLKQAEDRLRDEMLVIKRANLALIEQSQILNAGVANLPVQLAAIASLAKEIQAKPREAAAAARRLEAVARTATESVAAIAVAASAAAVVSKVLSAAPSAAPAKAAPAEAPLAEIGIPAILIVIPIAFLLGVGIAWRLDRNRAKR